MKADAKELLSAVDKARKCIRTSAVLPVLSGVLITPGRVEATDFETAIRADCAMRGESLETVVPARLLSDCLKKMGGEVEMTLNVNALTISDVRRSYSLNAWPQDDFPRLFGETTEGHEVIPIEDWHRLIDRALDTFSTEETRPIIHGILLEFGDTLAAVATDSYRLVRVERPITGEARQVIVKSPGLRIVQKLLRGATDVGVRFFESATVFDVPGASVAVRNVDGVFPNYKQLIPESAVYSATVDRRALAEAVGAVGLMCQRNAPVRLDFNGELRVWGQTQDVGTAEERIPYTGNIEGEYGYNHAFLLSGLEMFSGDSVTMQVDNPLRPAVFREDDTLYLLMPVRLSN